MKRYVLEIYLPDNPGSDSACLLDSDEPFLTIQKGDLINPRTWNSHYSGNLKASTDQKTYGIVLRVTGAEHFISQREDGTIIEHRIGIFTEAVEDVAENRP